MDQPWLVQPCSGTAAPFRLSRESGDVAGFVVAGTQVQVVEQHGKKWAQIIWKEPDQKKGWVKMANLRPADAQSIANSTVSGCPGMLGRRRASDASEDRPRQRLCLVRDVADPSATCRDECGVSNETAEPVPDWLELLSAAALGVPLSLTAPSSPVPSHCFDFWDRLYNYQQAGIKFALSRAGRVLLADEMGLGKSVQALAIAAHFREQWPALIVAPTHLCAQWRAHAIEWLSLREDTIQVVRHRTSIVLPDKDMVICSYELLRASEQLRRTCDGNPFRVIVFDECHRLKNMHSQRFQTLAHLARDSTRVILLSGTPMPNSAAEIWAQLSLVLPAGRMPDFESFANRYSYRVESKRLGVRWKGFRNMTELNMRVLRHIMVQRRKGDVGQQLPAIRRYFKILSTTQEVPELQSRQEDEAKIRNEKAGEDYTTAASAGSALPPDEDSLKKLVVDILACRNIEEMTLGLLRSELEQRLNLDPGSLDEYRDMIRNLAADEVTRIMEHGAASQEESAFQEEVSTLAFDSMRRQHHKLQEEAWLACNLKFRNTLRYVQHLLVSGTSDGLRKVVLFAHHRKMLTALEVMAKFAGFRSVRLDGRVPRDTRHRLVASFQTDNNVHVAVCSIMACSEGLELTAARTVVFCELHWTPAVLEQCEARVHRHGQANAVDIWYMVAEGTIDERMCRTLEDKRSGSRQADPTGG